MRTFITVVLVLMVTTAFAQTPMFSVGMKSGSFNSRDAFDIDNSDVSIVGYTEGPAIRPSVTLDMRRMSLNYSYTSPSEKRYIFNSTSDFFLFGNQFPADQDVNLAVTTQVYKIELKCKYPGLSPLFMMEWWKTDYAVVSEGASVDESDNRFLLGAGGVLSQPLGRFATANCKAAYMFLSGQRGAVVDGSISFRSMLPYYTNIGYLYRESHFSSDTLTRRIRVHGPYLEIGVSF